MVETHLARLVDVDLVDLLVVLVQAADEAAVELQQQHVAVVRADAHEVDVQRRAAERVVLEDGVHVPADALVLEQRLLGLLLRAPRGVSGPRSATDRVRGTRPTSARTCAAPGALTSVTAAAISAGASSRMPFTWSDLLGERAVRQRRLAEK